MAHSGRIRGVLDAIARALRLDEAERAHLFHLAQAADGTSAALRPRRRPRNSGWCGPACNGPSTPSHRAGDRRQQQVRPARHQPPRPRAYADLYNDPNAPPNFARFAFLDTAAQRFYPDWDLAADITVANLRTAAGQDPHNKGLHDLVGELSTRSDEFRRRWGSHNVRTHGTGIKHSTTTSSASSPSPTRAWTSEPNPASA